MIYPPNQKPLIWSIDPGIVAYNCQKARMPHPTFAMPMWEGAGSRVLDLSGHGNHGEVVGASWVVDGMDFATANKDSVDLTSSVSLGINSTEFVLIKLDLINTNNMLFGEADYSADYHIYFTSSGNLFYKVGGSYINLGHSWSTDTWYYLTFVRKGNTVYFYQNGIYINDATNESFGAVVTQFDKIGAESDGGNSYSIDGIVSFALAYNTALSAAQVKFLYDNPYFMYQIPEELYGYVAAVGGTTIPIIYHHRRRR